MKILKKRPWHRRFPVNFAKFLRAPFLTERLRWLLVTLFYWVWNDFLKGNFIFLILLVNLYPFLQGSLEWPFSELFFAYASLWNQYKYIAFNIFSCRILIILYKMLIITWISDEKTNELTIYGISCRNVTIFNWQKLASLFQVQEKLKACRSSK